MSLTDIEVISDMMVCYAENNHELSEFRVLQILLGGQNGALNEYYR